MILEVRHQAVGHRHSWPNLVRPLAMSGIDCAVVARPGAPPHYSRFARATLCWSSFSGDDTALVDELVRFGAAQPERPVLFYEEYAQLLLVSRHRDRLKEAFRFVVADPDLVESLVDKSRFGALAERLSLPVPPTRPIEPTREAAAHLGLRFPIVIKPLMRVPAWEAIAEGQKALQVETAAALDALWPRLQALGGSLLAQELVPGPESRIESYHVYVDQQ